MKQKKKPLDSASEDDGHAAFIRQLKVKNIVLKKILNEIGTDNITDLEEMPVMKTEESNIN